jgi:hypothetical protein
MNMFEKASRLRLRFNTAAGLLDVEDLWQLPLTSTKGVNLDQLAVALQDELQSSVRTSFVHEAKTSDEQAQLRFDIAIHIIKVKLEERAAAENAQKAREQRQRIMSLIEKREDEAMSQKSIDELRAELEKLG